MISKTVLAVIAATVVAASPAFAQSRTAHQTHVRDYGIYNYAPASPVDQNDPALTGGGSVGYNSHLNKNY